MVELVEGDGGDRTGLLDEKLDLALAGQGVDHVGHRAHKIDGVKNRHRLGAVGQGHGDFVPGPDTHGFEGPGADVDLLHHLLIGGPFAHEHIGGAVGEAPGAALHRLVERAALVVEMGGHLPIGGKPGGLHCGFSTHSQVPPSAVGPAGPGLRACTARSSRSGRNRSRPRCAHPG